MIKVDFKLFCFFLEKGRGVAATPRLLWIALKIEICFSIMKISQTPASDGWGSLKRSLSRPTVEVDVISCICNHKVGNFRSNETNRRTNHPLEAHFVSHICNLKEGRGILGQMEQELC